MGIKENVIKIGEHDIKIRQLSFAGQMRLMQLGEKRTSLDLYKECLDKSDIVEQLTPQEGLELVKELNKLNEWAILTVTDDNYKEDLQKKKNGE